jgi:hypothetical protein
MVLIRTRDRRTVRFGFGFRSAHRGQAIRTSIRAARDEPGTGPLPVLPREVRPWWAYFTLTLTLFGAWLAISPY